MPPGYQPMRGDRQLGASLFSNWCKAEILKFLILLLLLLGCVLCVVHLVYEVLGIKSRASSVLGTHNTNRATPHLIYLFV